MLPELCASYLASKGRMKMRYFVRRVGPGQVMGIGCVLGLVLALLLVIVLVAMVLLIQSGSSDITRLLGPLGNTVAPGQKAAWNVVGLSSLLLLLIFGLFFGLGAWLVALGFNLVAQMTGGLALDVTPDASSMPVFPANSPLYPAAVGKDPTMPLPRPLPGFAPAAFPSTSSSSSSAAGAASPAPQSSGGSSAGAAAASGGPAPGQSVDPALQVVEPRLISEADASHFWVVRKLTTTIGSDPSNDVVLTGDAGIAPRHAELRIESSGYVLYDLGSPGGTYVNDRRVQGRNLLKDGFHVKFGSTGMLFRQTK